MNTPLIFEHSREGRTGFRPPMLDVPESDLGKEIGSHLLCDEEPNLPEVSEPEVVRHYTRLSHRNHSIDLGFYPLGSCTMKYNPKVNEMAAAEFADLHPFQPVKSCQGILELMHETLEYLCCLTGMSAGTLQPYAGAHGEFTGMKIFRAYHDARRDAKRRVVLVPDSAHGTNPASAHIAGFDVVEVQTNSEGMIDVECIKPHLNEELAGIMLTNPSTLGLFERHVVDVAKAVHDAGGLLYYDGANLNAIVGTARPGDMGFDVVHLNLHKTFSTPHGGGGPGAGPVFVAERLSRFLPGPVITHDADGYHMDQEPEESIGRVSGFHGNIGIVVRAYMYILMMGRDGLKRVSELAVLNANYLRQRVREHLPIAFEGLCKHEFVATARELKHRNGVSAMDIAKRLLDFGVHAPTVYFPINVPEALMIEPTETETLESLNAFVEQIATICAEAATDPDKLHSAPHETPVGRVDEVRAARNPILTWEPPKQP